MMLSSWRGVVDWSFSFLRWLFELWLARAGSQAGDGRDDLPSLGYTHATRPYVLPSWLIGTPVLSLTG
jgi:hypothetical protein